MSGLWWVGLMEILAAGRSEPVTTVFIYRPLIKTEVELLVPPCRAGVDGVKLTGSVSCIKPAELHQIELSRH